MVRLSILIIVMLFGVARFAAAQTAQAQLQSCLLRANTGHDPDERDENKFGCIQEFNQTISIERCAQIASVSEYTTTADEIRKYCIFDLKANPTFSQCMKIAKKTEYGENGDEIRWQCLRLLTPKATLNECKKIGQDMVLPYNKRRAIDLCSMNY